MSVSAGISIYPPLPLNLSWSFFQVGVTLDERDEGSAHALRVCEFRHPGRRLHMHIIIMPCVFSWCYLGIWRCTYSVYSCVHPKKEMCGRRSLIHINAHRRAWGGWPTFVPLPPSSPASCWSPKSARRLCFGFFAFGGAVSQSPRLPPLCVLHPDRLLIEFARCERLRSQL